ncbi:MAG: hypothetical protein U0797_11335 [Gemmataceae bacterium]
MELRSPSIAAPRCLLAASAPARPGAGRISSSAPARSVGWVVSGWIDLKQAHRQHAVQQEAHAQRDGPLGGGDAG